MDKVMPQMNRFQINDQTKSQQSYRLHPTESELENKNNSTSIVLNI